MLNFIPATNNCKQYLSVEVLFIDDTQIYVYTKDMIRHTFTNLHLSLKYCRDRIVVAIKERLNVYFFFFGGKKKSPDTRLFINERQHCFFIDYHKRKILNFCKRF